jgi:acetate kinase
MNILVINCGSSSVKYQIIEIRSELSIGQGSVNLSGSNTVRAAIAEILEKCREFRIEAIGHRVVHGGNEFHDAVLIDEKVMDAISRWAPLAPLHNPANLEGIRAACEVFSGIPQVAVFDTAFHSQLPRRAATYAIDVEIAQAHHIRRYGFHGTSHQFVAEKAAHHLGRPLSELRLISLHLGNGASACAIEFGHSTDTSMGMTPLEGLVMGTRPGDIDAGIVLLLARDCGMDIESIDRLLNEQSGLKGISGISNDLREIEAAAAQGHDQARLAIAIFAHQARKYIGAYAANMGGVDAIVLTGGIGENSASMRKRILQRLEFLGLVLDEDRNTDAMVTHKNPVSVISQPHSRVLAMVVKTNEELKIAQQTAGIVQKRHEVNTKDHIPIAISARHIHLNEETFAALFGSGQHPERIKDLVQPGQYACKQTVSLIGPRGKIDNVRLLGPLRKRNQAEISRTDEFHLGIDAPVRDSGNTENSAPVTVQGPAGIVHLKEGLICARRHIHMHPGDATRFGVQDMDVVEVGVSGGNRSLVFGDVLIRVDESFRLEMHIDTDEANAAELSNNSNGTLVYTGVDNASATLRSRKT